MSSQSTTYAADIPQMLEKLYNQAFYGSLEIKLEAGRIVLLKKTETFKPKENATRQSEPIDVNPKR
jgi:hypothetical protein